MKVLLDQNLPRGLRAYLTEHEVTTADEAGWAKLSNGKLLRAAENEGYAVLLSADQNLIYQQNMSGRSLAIVILSTNHWLSLQSAATEIAVAVSQCEAGSFTRVQVLRIPTS